MIDIRVIRRDGGLEITAAGHAEYGLRGRDIVCAGVSALLFGFVAYMERHALPSVEKARGEAEAGDTPTFRRDVRDGYLWLCTHGWGGVDTAAWAVTEAGLSLIAHAHPACVRLREVPMEGGEDHG